MTNRQKKGPARRGAEMKPIKGERGIKAREGEETGGVKAKDDVKGHERVQKSKGPGKKLPKARILNGASQEEKSSEPMLVPLPDSFYDRPGVVAVAKDLLGKVLVTNFEGGRTAGRIVEVEAYNGVVDRASHAFSGRRTRRTEVMFGPAGVAYVYLIYGIHHLFNVVTNKRDVPHAVLVRGLEPVEGIPVMLARTGKKKLDHTLTRGPGNLSRALGLLTKHTGTSLLGDTIFIADDGFRLRRSQIVATPRIGVDYAGEDAALLYRFFIDGNPYVSGPRVMRPR
jgi:DNA-3-methyladenine glycosylase